MSSGRRVAVLLEGLAEGFHHQVLPLPFRGGGVEEGPAEVVLGEDGGKPGENSPGGPPRLQACRHGSSSSGKPALEHRPGPGLPS